MTDTLEQRAAGLSKAQTKIAAEFASRELRRIGSILGLAWDPEYHMEVSSILRGSAALIEAQQQQIHALQEQLKAHRYEAEECDKPQEEKQFQAEILAAHPTKTDDHATYLKALELVGERHSKYDLVDLVNWLLVKEKALQAENELVRGVNEVVVANMNALQADNARLREGLLLNDYILRSIRHRDARWHDDEEVTAALKKTGEALAAKGA